MMTYTTTLPEIPPSVNGLYRNARGIGRAKTKRYLAWIQLAGMVVKRCRTPIDQDVAVEYVYKRPDKRRRDVANLEKAVSDLLVSVGVLADDCQIVDIRMRWGAVKNGAVSITITPITDKK